MDGSPATGGAPHATPAAVYGCSSEPPAFLNDLIHDLIRLLGQYPVDRCATYTERGRDCAGRFPAGVHPLSQSGFGGVECFGPPD